jgi:uncharacterized protein with GYD domain
MTTYLVFVNWTDQGIRSVKDSPKRLDAAKKIIKDMGGELKAFYMTQGNYDAVLIVEMPNDEKLASFILKVATAGNIRTTTLKAYSEEEYRKIISGLS